jgi:hypothetical protein
MPLPELEYRRLKEQAKDAARHPEKRDEVLREIARYVISELRSFGVSDGGLCAWTHITGFDSFKGDISPHVESARFQSLMDSMWSLAKLGGVVHGKGKKGVGRFTMKFYSESMTRALESEAWKATRVFRESYGTAKKPGDEVLFYNPPIDPNAKNRPWV